MKKTMRQILALLAAALLTIGPAAAETLEVEEVQEEAADTVIERDGWYFDSRGFLAGDNNPGEEYLKEDAEEGVWEYASKDLAVTVRRYREKEKKRTREYCVAEIWASPASPISSIATEPTKKKGAGIKQVSPELLVEKHPCVFAVSDDMYGIRFERNFKVKGIVIRNGELINAKTRNSKKSRPWPNLDAMAVYPDGSMKSFICDAQTAEQFQEQGAVHVYSFGPWLLSEGTINPDVLKANYYPNNEPRVAIGMVEPYHYVVVAVRGRPKTQYAGVHLDWMAQKLQEYGCVEALNLDGGESVTMIFNGKIVLQGGDKLRSQGSMIVFGLKEQAGAE